MADKDVPEGDRYGHQLESLIRGYLVSRMIRSVADLEIADKIPPTGRVPVRTLAAECQVKPEALLRICRALASFEIFTLADEEAGHSPMSLLLRNDMTGSQHLAARFWAAPGSWGACEELDSALRSDTAPHEAKWGMSRFDYMRSHPEEGRVYDARMAGSSGNRQEAIAAAYDFSHFQKILDVGGGNGQLLCTIMTRCPTVQGTVFDREHVVSLIPESARADGRLSVVSGDFFEHVPSGADLYLLSWILHDWPDEVCIRILRNCRQAAGRNGMLIIADRILEPRPDLGDPLDYLSDIQMMVLGGRERTASEFETLLRATGFGLEAVIPTASPVSVLVAKPVEEP